MKSVHGTHQDLSLLFVPPVRSGGTEIKFFHRMYVSGKKWRCKYERRKI